MNNKLLEVEQGYTYYCNNCNSKFTFIYEFNPTCESQSYYNCSNCNAILPTKDLKKVALTNSFLYYLCCYCMYK